MAGAGYKLFNTGDVLTAAQVNTYLMEQTVMVFADAAARTTALTGVVSEGMLSYLKDTNAVEVYNGSAWVSSDDPNAIQNTIVDAKGDLVTATAADTPARLAVGNNGETLVADSAATTGLRWQGNYSAGKSKIINGAFDHWQRGTSFNYTGSAASIFTADRFALFVNGNGTFTVSQQSFTAGTAPVSGYESTFFLRLATNTVGTSTTGILWQPIEDVRTLAGQTITISFWAKADSNRTITYDLVQDFGSGGSSRVFSGSTNASLTTSWQRFSATYTLGSMSGKTIGTGSSLQARFLSTPAASSTIDIWGVQVEAGSVATAFQTASGSIQGELALCQRYYYRITGNTNVPLGYGANASTSIHRSFIFFPVEMRIAPTALEQTGTASDYAINQFAVGVTTCTAVPSFFEATTRSALVSNTLAAATLTTAQPGGLRSNATGAYFGWSAEL